MKMTDPKVEEQIRQSLKRFNPFMLLMWRLGFGQWFNRWPDGYGNIMVLTHTGRRSGLRRQTPVNYAIVDGDVYCTAGFGQTSDWYRNIKANPNIQIWLPEGWWEGLAEEVTDPQKRIPIIREVIRASGFAGRLAGLDAATMTDEELDSATRSYPLIHIRRTAACTGPGGPGDLAWIWPLATVILLPLALRRRKK